MKKAGGEVLPTRKPPEAKQILETLEARREALNPDHLFANPHRWRRNVRRDALYDYFQLSAGEKTEEHYRLFCNAVGQPDAFPPFGPKPMNRTNMPMGSMLPAPREHLVQRIYLTVPPATDIATLRDFLQSYYCEVSVMDHIVVRTPLVKIPVHINVNVKPQSAAGFELDPPVYLPSLAYFNVQFHGLQFRPSKELRAWISLDGVSILAVC
jgi:hypothetical protein